MLGLKRSTLYQWADERRIAYVKATVPSGSD